MAHPIVLSARQVEPLLTARDSGACKVATSSDLGLTTVEVRLEPDGAVFPNGETLRWEDAKEILRTRSSGRLSEDAYVLTDGSPRKLQVFSEESGLFYGLVPTDGAPTMTISGFPMHRIKGIDPHQDTLLKLRAAGPALGRVLDTCTGLGYTAIGAAKTATEVVTIEVDSGALEIAALNPWSRGLFENPKITQLLGDSFDEVQRFEDRAFNLIIHDPPAFSLAGDLYSGEFYRRLHRVLRRGGRVFHYIGNPEKSSGARVTRGVIRRLTEAGFASVTHRPEAFGVVAQK